MAGLPLTASSHVLEGNVASEDAVAWQRLRDAGMVPLGHTHTHEFAAGGTTDQVGNPHSLDLVAGGSSGGSAAALAARMTPAALGSDTCGSLRIPAACCGVSSIKPTHGRIPIGGVIPLAASLDHVGPMARSVADCSALLAALAEGGPETSALMPPPQPMGELPLAARPGPRPLEGLTVALTERPVAADMQAEVAEAYDTARRACEQLGARVVELEAPWTFDWNDLSIVLMSDAFALHKTFAGKEELYRPAIAEFMEIARNFTDAQAYLAAQQRRAEGTAVWEHWFAAGGVDFVLEPTLPIVPYERGPGYDRGHAGGAGDPMIALTALWDMTGMPVVTLPVKWNVAVSLIAPRGQEAPLTQAGIDLQEHALS
jgi:aspartyl-tRNA(Asn)/glutamyl-tRNA(Gln) amidotransferase subunit A